MDFSFLFDEKVLEIQELSPGYDDHASDVWLVKTEEDEVIVRTSRMIDEPNNDFWWGCKRLFGIDPRRVFDLEAIHQELKRITSLPVPKVMKKGKYQSKEFMVVEKLPGEVITSFIDQPFSVMQSLGVGLAEIHKHRKNYIGSPSGKFRVRLDGFHEHVKESMTELVEKFYYDDLDIKEKLSEIHSLLELLPNPDYATYVLVDMDSTQFLSNGKKISGLVDTEAFVIAPRELDFIGLEYILNGKSANDFKIGYESVLELPDLSKVRTPYRYLYRLLSVQGDVEIEDWLNHPVLF